jgi:hypothetical protein
MYWRMRSGRLVSTWKVWPVVAAITAKIRSIHSSGTRSWNRSLIELTKMRRGCFQRSGSAERSSISRTSPVHFPPRVSPS